MKKKILYIQHASGFGGSAMSLLYTLQEIQKITPDAYSLVIALAKWNKAMADFYTQAGFEVVKPEWIDTYEHTQAVSFNLLNPLHWLSEIKQLANIKRAKNNTKKLLEMVKPDLVHLNSVVLLGSAVATQELGIPLVWHVRENPVHGIFGLRYNWLKGKLKQLPNKIIFISNADKFSWGNPSNGALVYNFIDFDKFQIKDSQPKDLDGTMVPKSDITILFLGGVARIKGGLYLIKAINTLMTKYPDKNIVLLFPGSIYTSPKYLVYNLAKKILPLFGQGTYSQKIEREILRSPKPVNFIKLPFFKDVPKLLSLTDVLVFPSIRPHFARPVIEAGAMRKPVIGSDLDGVRELIDDGKNGFLVRPKSSEQIAKRLEIFLLDPSKADDMGAFGHSIATEKYQAKNNILKIISTYKNLI
jgi:glycosyltransferase involved in cell wall biosynthesis